ncbi:MAG: GWxTD domain-containing protein [Ignavibacteriae bacterium]|nr:GWxTD domain-containing protein [Ignavibacteriota bacterium]
MKTRIFVLFLIINFAVYSQEKEKKIPVFLEHHSLIVDGNQKEFLTYKIPYNVLLFTKVEDIYESKFSISIEFYDSTLFILREIKTSIAQTSDYEMTKKNSIYYQDMIEFEILPGKYNLNINLLIEGVDGQIDLPPYKINVEKLNEKKIHNPIFIEKNKTFSNENILLNFSNSIPLSANNYDMLVSFTDTSINKINYIITQFDKEIIKDSAKIYFDGELKFIKQKDLIFVSQNKSNKSQNIFSISNFSKLLNEGKAEIEISYNNQKEKFPLEVTWINKPKVLASPEYSIRLLSYIEDEEVVKDLLFTDEEKYYQNLKDYWSSKFSTDGIKYNYAMNEYYLRADYAIEHFSSLNSNDGAENDRGRIYITYGRPTSIERNYSERNEIMEVWNYEKLGRDFIFKDTTGTGKFILVK